MCNMGSNDVYDFDTGADINKRESVVNLVGRYKLISHYTFRMLNEFSFQRWLITDGFYYIFEVVQEP